MTAPRAIARGWRKLTAPFRIRIYTAEHTRVEVRSFPPHFRIHRIESMQERIDRVAAEGGGTLHVETGTHFIYETLQVPAHVADIVGEGPDTIFWADEAWWREEDE